MRYFLVVGEASGDLHASRLMRSIKALDPTADFMFVGGDLMAVEAGRPPLVHYRELAFMGFIPVLRNLDKINNSGYLVQELMRAYNPDVVIPVDYAGFNLRYILPFAKQHLDCPVVYYIAPKLWAWKKWRIHRLTRYTDLLLCILPFEQAFFERYGLKTLYVGNPCVDATLALREQQVSTPCTRKQIALLSGSRRQELKANLPTMLKATEALEEDYKIVVAGAPGLEPADYAPYLAQHSKVELRFGVTYSIISESEAALVTSGTATLETALLGTPQIVCYRMGGLKISRWIWKTFFSVPYISLVNLILGREAVPELIGAEVEPSHIYHKLKNILRGGSERSKQLESIDELRLKLGKDSASEQAARALIAEIETKRG
ncbi:MAG: lipid-A-disaccharide synthase [Porphyromonadaceae bacterium]|nr:lipid-A-disaccharide synthase [Porphyromonadaceae bacterium]